LSQIAETRRTAMGLVMTPDSKSVRFDFDKAYVKPDAKDTPAGRPTAIRSKAENKIQSFPRLGGLHHRYAVAA
jgi:hypothetical protein